MTMTIGDQARFDRGLRYPRVDGQERRDGGRREKKFVRFRAKWPESRGDVPLARFDQPD